MTFLGSTGETGLGIWVVPGAVLSTLTLTASPRNFGGDLMWNQVDGNLARAIVGLQASPDFSIVVCKVHD